MAITDLAKLKRRGLGEPLVQPVAPTPPVDAPQAPAEPNAPPVAPRLLHQPETPLAAPRRLPRTGRVEQLNCKLTPALAQEIRSRAFKFGGLTSVVIEEAMAALKTVEAARERLAKGDRERAIDLLASPRL